MQPKTAFVLVGSALLASAVPALGGGGPLPTPSPPQLASAAPAPASAEVTPSHAQKAQAAPDSHWYIAQGTACVKRLPGQSGAWLQSRFRMHAGSMAETSVSTFRIQGREIPAGASTAFLANWHRKWWGQIAGRPRTGIDGPWTANMEVLIPIPDVEKAWDTQIRLTWIRDFGRPDWRTNLRVKFNAQACPVLSRGQGGGVAIGSG